MAAFMIITAKIHEREKFIQSYGLQATKLVAKFGGESVVLAPGSGSGYLVFLEHGGHGIEGGAPSMQSSNRGLTMGSFGSSQFDSVYESAAAHGYSISRAPATRLLPNLGECRSMMVTDPSGFDINIFES